MNHTETRILPYTPEQMFMLVLDIEKYPQFLPWCQALRISERRGNTITAQMIVGYKLFRERFSCRINFEPNKSVYVEYLDGPLKFLKNEWVFDAAEGNACRVGFNIDFEFSNAVLQKIAETFFNEALKRMVNAFENRARVLYTKTG